jgi:hypothetical protein
MDERGVSEVGTVLPAGQAADPTAGERGTGGASVKKEKVKEQAANVATSAKDVASTTTTEAAQVAGTASDGAKDVAKETGRQVNQVAGEAAEHARQLLAQTGDQLKEQAAAQTGRAAEGLRTVTSQLTALRNGRPEEAGAVGDYAQQLTAKLGEVADRLDDRGFEGIVDDVHRFARRRPGVFLMAAGAAGFLAGRFLRGTQAASSDGDAPAIPDHRFADETLRTPPDPDRYVVAPAAETIDLTDPVPLGVDAGRGAGAF